MLVDNFCWREWEEDDEEIDCLLVCCSQCSSGNIWLRSSM